MPGCDKDIMPKDALIWQYAMGAEAVIADTPHSWFNAPVNTPALEMPVLAVLEPVIEMPKKPAALVTNDLSHITSLTDLKTALADFDKLAIRKTATNMVFFDGVENAKVMVVGEAPGADEDRLGKPFVGASGKLLDRVLASIGLTRERNLYITNVINWRPPGNRTPTPQEIALSLPFLQRHIELQQPEIIVLVGATPVKAILGTSEGITKLRGRWFDYPTSTGKTIPTMATFHPAYLLRAPQQKALVWKDMLNLQKKLLSLGIKN